MDVSISKIKLISLPVMVIINRRASEKRKKQLFSI